jgi:hypothetical protein
VVAHVVRLLAKVVRIAQGARGRWEYHRQLAKVPVSPALPKCVEGELWWWDGAPPGRVLGLVDANEALADSPIDVAI